MNNLMKFSDGEFGELNVLEIDGKMYFPATACAKVLGYDNTRDAIIRHCKGVVKHDTLTTGGTQKINFIPEGDLYRLIVHSRLPAAERFEKWVFDEVLPTIRREGYYAPDIQTIVKAAVEAAVSEAIKAYPKPQPRRRRTGGAIVGIIANLDAPLRQEVDLMLAGRKMTYKGISKALEEEYGIHVSKSSIGRYAKQVEETRIMEIETPQCVYIDSGEEHLPICR
ncbi:MAG: BRO family protein [Clostridia bacterium]|nr:BRO family protein [Clostridia bacterium]